MPPMTPAEKQKKYRERLKSKNPEKYEEMKKKSSKNALKYYRNKRDNYTPEQKEEQRRKWKEDRKKSQMPSTSQENSAVEEAVKLRNIQRRIEYKLKLENLELRNKVSNLSKGFKSLERKYNRQKKVIDSMNKNYENLIMRVKRFEDSIKSDETKETIEKRQNIVECTPRKKVDEFICENVPDIETPKKEVIKQKLLEYNVLTETLKQEMQKSNNYEKNTFKKILDNNLVKKYKQKSKFTISLGLKSNLKQKKRVHNIRKSIELRNKIEEFYNRDDVTRATAGKKEYRTYKKVSRQIRYQLDKLKILHQKFIAEVEKISFSTFKKYRPFYVLPPKIKNCETCACVKHSNMQFLIDELKSQGLLQQDSINDITCNFVCDFKSKQCMYGECGICADRKLDGNGKEETEKVKWFEWSMKEHEYGQGDKAKKIKRMMKITKEGTLRDLLNKFNEDMEKFKIHVFNFYHQYNKYKDCRNNLKENEVIIHIDFSENFTCKYFKEVQAMHFIKDQITLHTGVLYLKNEKPLSFCSISANNEHCPEAIWAHLDPIIKYVKSDYPDVRILHFFSDGPTTQYRQKKNFYLFSKNIYEYGFEKATWSFFESAHGKGAADGIGGAIKRKLDAKIAQGIDIPDAKTAFNVLNASDTEIKLFFIPAEDIKPLDINLIPITGTMKIHQLMTAGMLKVKYRILSCFCNDLNGMCGCYSPMIHEFKSVEETGKRQTNKGKKRNTSEKENEKYYVKTKKIKKLRKVSTSSDSEDDSMDIEYADSDETCYMDEDTNIFDMELTENKDIPDVLEQATNYVLDEKTGVLINCNKKIFILSDKILKDTVNRKKNKNKDSYIIKEKNERDNKSTDDIPIAKIDQSKVKEGENKIKVIYESEDRNKCKDDKNKAENEEGCTKAEENLNKAKEDADEVDKERNKAEKERNKVKEEETEAKEYGNKTNEDINKTEEELYKDGEGKNKVEGRNEHQEDENSAEENIAEDKQIKVEEDNNKAKQNENFDQKKQLNSENLLCNVLKINDTVLVRYYQKKTWKYYVGFVMNLELRNSEHYYKIQFLKTVKDSTRLVKFVNPKKRDIDIVPEVSIVKQVNMTEEKDSKEYYLSDDNDTVYFE